RRAGATCQRVAPVVVPMGLNGPGDGAVGAGTCVIGEGHFRFRQRIASFQLDQPAQTSVA
ncbi:MAG: hypothetical protein KBG34_03720, partial [Pseudoxanthomonas sp.]|nr:hypothetical protein [Pseudoxanthomonas sp.]